MRASGRIALAPSSPENSNPFAQIERRYERFLVNERGLSRATVQNYLPIIHTFLAERFVTGAVALGALTVRDVNQFIVRQSQRLSRSRAKLLVTALRSFLRHLHQRGDIPAGLAGALLPVVSWRLSGVPKSLAPEQVEAIIHSCDLRTAAGRRDRAILLLLARLGLRGGEVAAMTLDDLDWDAGVVTVSGKGQRRHPLPREVGEALVAYLRDGRPPCPTRRVFVRIHAPHVDFAGPIAITNVVHRAFPKRAVARSEVAEKELRKRTLTNLYNGRPQWLDDAHVALDAAVAAAYGWSPEISKEDALQALLELNRARISSQMMIHVAQYVQK